MDDGTILNISSCFASALCFTTAVEKPAEEQPGLPSGFPISLFPLTKRKRLRHQPPGDRLSLIDTF